MRFLAGTAFLPRVIKMNWEGFEERSPELARIGRERLNRKIAYLATIKKDGSPRLHPVTAFIGSGKLFIFTEPSSPKIGDLQNDGRYTLHNSVEWHSDEPLIEFLVSGHTETITDHDIRQKATLIADSPVVTEGYYLFEFHIAYALVVEYDADWQPVVRRWKRGVRK